MTSIIINGEIIDKAKELGLNISKTCENGLKEAIEALEQRKRPTETNVGYIDTFRVYRSALKWNGRD